MDLLGATSPARGGRRIAVLGDMLELGPQAAELHAELAEDLVARATSICCSPPGPLMARALLRRARKRCAARIAPRRSNWRKPSLAAIRPGDVVMVKGSNGSRMSRDRRGAAKEKFAAANGQLRKLDMLTLLADCPIYYSPLNIFRYITFRAAMAAATALFFVFFFGPGDHRRAAPQAGQGPADPRATGRSRIS